MDIIYSFTISLIGALAVLLFIKSVVAIKKIKIKITKQDIITLIIFAITCFVLNPILSESLNMLGGSIMILLLSKYVSRAKWINVFATRLLLYLASPHSPSRLSFALDLLLKSINQAS